MRRIAILSSCLLFVTAACAQVNPHHRSEPGFDPTAVRYGEGITPAALSKQLHIIAGPEMEGRETATRGQQKAAAYIISQFEQAGLQPGVQGKWEQYYPLYTDSLLNSAIIVGDSTFIYGRDFYADLRAGASQVLAVHQVVYAGQGIVNNERDDYDRLEVKDQVVLIREEVKHELSRNRSSLQERIKTADEKGVAALMVITPYASGINQDKLRTTGIYLKKDSIQSPNVYYISPAMAAVILGVGSKGEPLLHIEKIQAPALVKTTLQLTLNKKGTTLLPSNVLGYLEGTDKKDEVVFITAHYDHLGKNGGNIFYGADDDGSGTSAVIEIARAFALAKQEGHGPRRSIVFMTVSGEEKGLLGSQYYTEHPVYPLKETVTDLNIDMIGRIDPAHEKDTNYLYIIGDNKLSSTLRTINESANNAYTKLQLDYKYNDPNDPEQFYYRSDHYMFAQHGIPIIFYFNGTHADYHQPTDTVEKINFSLLAKRAQLVFFTAWDIANREHRLVVDKHDK
ncbi:M28 family peptidase [Chitinophaga sp. 30R24]|uniref:M28 family peptidase n=1 Tax=Chitinophaga sp. 30R24 TaxID=3248838 RepID=UPI003B8FA569